MPYKGLPPTAVVASLDTTGNNTGNWTAQIPSTPLVGFLTEFEMYKATIDGPIGSAVSVYVDNKKWSHTSQGWQNEWDPAQPLLMNAGQTLYFYWNVPTTALPVPTVTAWFRHATGAGSYIQ
jgi:hypothetical protein